MTLTPKQLERYRRNIDVPGLGVEGQERLLGARVLVVGAGGLGSAALPYLAGAGVGHLTVADGDDVELVNLQRQVLHVDLGVNKAVSAAERLRRLNSAVVVDVVPEMLTRESAAELMTGHDLVLDCCDTFGAKFMLSDAAQQVGARLVWAAAVGMQGQCSVFGVPTSNGRELWLRDLFPVEPDQADYPRAIEIGVLGAMVGQMGSLQATEAIKLITGIGEPLVGRLMILDALRARWDVVDVRPPSR